MMKLMNVNLYIYLIYLYLAKIMSDSYMKKKKKKNNDIDEYINLSSSPFSNGDASLILERLSKI